MLNIQVRAIPVRLKGLNYFLWVIMMKKNSRDKGVWSHTSNGAPWKICKVFAQVNEWRPEVLSLSNKSYFKLEEKKGQESPQCKGGLIKNRCWIFNLHLKPMLSQ
ncbi:hypothetical protein N665_0764s0008 [Sinapis alba]|nr:hypothetical protein N665_0764s0008 [Sinapis alba]